MSDGAVERGGRVRRRADRGVRVARDISARRQLRNPFGGARVLSDDEVVHLHTSALRYLQTSGVRVLLPEARRRFADAGATVDDSQMVRLDMELALALLSLAPAEFIVTARNAARSVTIGGDHLILAPVAGPPYAADRVRGRRPGTLADFDDFVRLTQRTEVLHSTTPAVEAQDVSMQLRHLHTTRSTLMLSDKVPYFYARGRGVVADSLEMIRLANGVSEEEFRTRPYCWTNINTNSPRQLDVPMCMGIIDSAAAGQATIMTPFTLAGAMAPVTLAGALVLQHLEAIAAIALAQIVRPGAPVVYGAFTSNVDMKSGAPAFGTPEGFSASIASGQLARHLGVPWRSQATSTSNTEDAQGAAETGLSLTAALLGGANVVLHSAGWQEGGLVASLEKFVLDVEVLDIVAESMRPIAVDDAALAMDSIDEVGPGGHFFGTAHTLERFATAFHEPVVFTRQNFGQWTEAGSPDAATRATEVWQRWLAEFEAPAIDTDAAAALEEFVARRIAEGGALPES
jgi:trimethylamine--corrinoid protein Co-methyltransferase